MQYSSPSVLCRLVEGKALSVGLEPPVYNHHEVLQSTTPSKNLRSIAHNPKEAKGVHEKVEEGEESEENYADEGYEESTEEYYDEKKPSSTEESTGTTFPRRVLNLFQIMAELAMTNRFPRPFSRDEPLKINLSNSSSIFGNVEEDEEEEEENEKNATSKVVITEFLPSIGFSLNSEEGREKFGQAIRRGLVTDEKSSGEDEVKDEESVE